MRQQLSTVLGILPREKEDRAAFMSMMPELLEKRASTSILKGPIQELTSAMQSLDVSKQVSAFQSYSYNVFLGFR